MKSLFKSLRKQLRPIYVEECLGEHRLRSLARVGGLGMARQAIAVGLQLVTAIVLSRLLPPATFGLLAMVMFFKGLMDMLSGEGFSDAAVQKSNLQLDELNNVFWLNLAIAAVLAFAFIASGPLIAGFYGQPDLVPICLVVGLLFLLQTMFRTHDALLRRTMNAEISLVVYVFPQIVNLVAAVTMALLGFGIWALVGGMVFAGISSRLMFLYFVRWNPGWVSKTSGFRGMFSYGLKSMSATIVTYLSQYSQELALGKFANPTEVGFYNRGQRILLMPLQSIAQPISQMILPALSAYQNNRAGLQDLLDRSQGVVVLITVPFAVFSVAFGDHLIVFLIGAQWATSGEVARWLALASIPMLICNLLGRGNAAMGRPGRGVPVVLLGLPFLIFGLVTQSPFGAIAVAKFYAIYRYIFYTVSVAYNLKGSGFGIKRYLISQVQFLLIAFCATSLMLLLRWSLSAAPILVEMLVIVCALPLVYLLFVVSFRWFELGRSVLHWSYERFGRGLHLPKILFAY